MFAILYPVSTYGKTIMMKSRVLCRGGLWILTAVLVVAAGCNESKTQEGGLKVEPDPVAVKPAPDTAESPAEAAKATVQPPVEPEQPPVVAEPVQSVQPAPGPNQPAAPVLEVKAEPNLPSPPAMSVVAEPVQPTAPVVEANAAADAPEAVELGLKFHVGDTGTYKVFIEADKSVEWEGPPGSKPTAFSGGHTGNVMEVTFTQTVKSLEAQGNATAEITLKALKYQQKVKDSITMDFDSANEADRGQPLGQILNQSYTVLLAPDGGLVRVLDAAKARAAASDPAAQALLSDSAIEERHSIAALDTGKSRSVAVGQTYSNVRTLNFGMMGAKAYERVYTLKEVQDANGVKVAHVQMDAVPSTQGAQQMASEQTVAFFAKMFDNKESYSGSMQFDVDTGTVRQYTETLKSEWMAVDPAAPPDQQPDALRMTALRSYRIQKLD